jgi:hypothetical protein
MDPEFQKEIDERILRLLDTHGVRYLTVKGSVEERLDQIESTFKPRS